MQAADWPGIYVRALRVLAICPLNRSLILEAGALEPLTDLLCKLDFAEAEAVVFTLSLLSKEEDARLNAFPDAALRCLLGLLKDEAAGPELRGTAATTLSRLSGAFQNRHCTSILPAEAAVITTASARLPLWEYVDSE